MPDLAILYNSKVQGIADLGTALIGKILGYSCLRTAVPGTTFVGIAELEIAELGTAELGTALLGMAVLPIVVSEMA
jgi:hypothetical protein